MIRYIACHKYPDCPHYGGDHLFLSVGGVTCQLCVACFLGDKVHEWPTPGKNIPVLYDLVQALFCLENWTPT